jgi:hypothetical protein
MKEFVAKANQIIEEMLLDYVKDKLPSMFARMKKDDLFVAADWLEESGNYRDAKLCRNVMESDVINACSLRYLDEVEDETQKVGDRRKAMLNVSVQHRLFHLAFLMCHNSMESWPTILERCKGYDLKNIAKLPIAPRNA